VAYLVYLRGGPEPVATAPVASDPRLVTVTERLTEIVMPVGDGVRGAWRPSEDPETINVGNTSATVFEYAGEYEGC
jgi:hypothetical protein